MRENVRILNLSLETWQNDSMGVEMYEVVCTIEKRCIALAVFSIFVIHQASCALV